MTNPDTKPDRAIWLTWAVEAQGIEHPEPWNLPWLQRLPILTARARFQCLMPCGHRVWGSYDVHYSTAQMRHHPTETRRRIWDTFVMSRISLEAEPCPQCGATTAPPPPTDPDTDPREHAPIFALPRIVWRH